MNVIAVGAEEDVVELDRRAGIAEERRNAERHARLDPELLAAGANDRVRHEQISVETTVDKSLATYSVGT